MTALILVNVGVDRIRLTVVKSPVEAPNMVYIYIVCAYKAIGQDDSALFLEILYVILRASDGRLRRHCRWTQLGMIAFSKSKQPVPQQLKEERKIPPIAYEWLRACRQFLGINPKCT